MRKLSGSWAFRYRPILPKKIIPHRSVLEIWKTRHCGTFTCKLKQKRSTNSDLNRNWKCLLIVAVKSPQALNGSSNAALALTSKQHSNTNRGIKKYDFIRVLHEFGPKPLHWENKKWIFMHLWSLRNMPSSCMTFYYTYGVRSEWYTERKRSIAKRQKRIRQVFALNYIQSFIGL